MIVAGGGGSDGATNKNGMYGGGAIGGSATQNYGSGGSGGTQTAGGTGSASASGKGTAGTYGDFGVGGKGYNASSGYAGAGGGGWYGGAGSYPDGSGDDDRGGGGGSGYIYTSATAINYPSGCLLNESYYLENASMKAGNESFLSPNGANETGHSGNGYCRITVVELSINTNNKIKISNSWKDYNKAYVRVEDEWKSALKQYVKIDNVWKLTKKFELPSGLNGKIWRQSNIKFGRVPYVSCINGKWFAGCDSDENYRNQGLRSSIDGKKWEKANSGIETRGYYGRVTYGNGIYISETSSYFFYSSDGENWESLESIFF